MSEINNNLDLISINNYLLLINLGINTSFYIYYIIRVIMKKCNKNTKHNDEILETLQKVEFNMQDMINQKNNLYKEENNDINIVNLDKIVYPIKYDIKKEEENIVSNFNILINKYIN